MDDSGTTPEGGRWLSYAELAELRGITRKAAIRLTQRHQWRRQPGNDGATRVFVPVDTTRRQTPRDGGTSDDFHTKALAVLEAALVEANTRADRAETRADKLQAQIDEQRAKIDELKAGQALMTDMHARELAVAQHDAQAGQQAAAELRRADAERKARGLVARLKDAWRGE